MSEKKEPTVAEIVAEARANSGMSEKEALELAVKETRAARESRAKSDSKDRK